MVATATIQEVTGSGAGVATNILNNAIRLFTIDQTTANPPQTTYPVIIPANATAGYKGGPTNYSFWKSVDVLFTTGGSGAEIISNIKHYSNGDITGSWTFGTNGQMSRGAKNGSKASVPQGCPAANYAQATALGAGAAIGIGGDPINDSTKGHPYFQAAGDGVADLNADTSVLPALIDSGPYTLSSPATCYEIVLQVKVDTTATQGTQASKTLTWQYDES